MSDKARKVEAFISLGGNIGDPSIAIEDALTALANKPGVTVTTRSRFYRTPPWGKTDQSEFVNACAGVKTTLTPTELLKTCLEVETSMGRVREERWGPRIIDLDILTYGDVTMDDPDLTLPHPYLTERAFVLVPLKDIAPDFQLNGTDISAMLEKLDTSEIVAMDQH
ncbi:2-amino-4-hydroxy-6-hydroxymethyldihydropteridine diphosphokinase [Cohaesibacter sp. CAU 1516]|uniref:2-amino-4-hydroxy-6- hydroxymethyldihydropteridine diphosphokinase n=1 Tax=Cohaesibacter sp. CAU 1516 TaxID=2576038 RepID=UPI0010FE680A|nr:2-amino-4-hydroxy-6-hydroxymethyldihydropteridine diphosphokinase [Cohaesibacter sp. CAU 1516]TLP48804.1 2-amino-4-hydroxy-6-hydroxymethyldihydropteridine diphosphokinase [Cohaesibacter sp. CAU 1516]